MLNWGFLLYICVTGLGWYVWGGNKFGDVFMLMDVCKVLLCRLRCVMWWLWGWDVFWLRFC